MFIIEFYIKKFFNIKLFFYFIILLFKSELFYQYFYFSYNEYNNVPNIYYIKIAFYNNVID